MRKDAAVRRQRIIELAADGLGPKAIAAQLDVTDRTVREHLNAPATVAELRAIQGERLRAITRRALATAATALEVLEAVARRGAAEGARVMAARAILDHTLKLIEVQDLAERIEALEERLGDDRPTTRKGVRQWAS
jgi:hypothetical protein